MQQIQQKTPLRKLFSTCGMRTEVTRRETVSTFGLSSSGSISRNFVCQAKRCWHIVYGKKICHSISPTIEQQLKPSITSKICVSFSKFMHQKKVSLLWAHKSRPQMVDEIYPSCFVLTYGLFKILVIKYYIVKV